MLPRKGGVPRKRHDIPLKRFVGGPRRADFLFHEGIVSVDGGSIGGNSSCKTRSGGAANGREERLRIKRKESAERTEPAAT